MQIEELEMLVKDQQAQIDYYALAAGLEADPYAEQTQGERFTANATKAAAHYELFTTSNGAYGWGKDKLRYAVVRGFISQSTYQTLTGEAVNGYQF